MKQSNPTTPQRRTSRWRNGLLGLGAALFMAPMANAQVANYSFAASAGTYTALVSPTSSGLTATADDNLSAALPIGFSFTYNGASYTTVKASSNGLVCFGTGSSATGNNLASTTTGTYNSVAPLWDDLQCTAGVNYKTSGSPGSQVLTVEFPSMEWRYNSNTPVISFQVKLYEATNVIAFVYQQEATAPNTPTASVGIKGNSGTDFISLQDLSASPTTSTSTSANSLATKPANGQVYTFSPPMACTGTPNAGSVPSPVSVCSGNTVTLTATGLSVGPGITYQWQESPDGTTGWASVVGGSGATTASYTTPAITATRYFRIVTTCSAGPASNNSNVVTVNAVAGSFPEDFSSGTITGNCWSQSGTGTAANLRYNASSAYGVGTGSIIWDFFSQSGTTNTLIYTSPTVAPVGSGMQLEFDVAGRQYSTSAIDSIYIEQSNNGGTSWTLVYAGSNEVGSGFNTLPISTSELNTPANNEWAARAYPLNASTNRVRFRGVSKFGNNVLVDNIALGAAPACQAPSALSATNATTSGADLGWTANGIATTWDLEIGTSGFTPTGTPTVDNTGNPYTWTGGSASTAYDFYVRADCGMDNVDVSTWTGPFTFNTACGAVSVPYLQDFEATTGTAVPNCWTVENVNGGTTWGSTASTAFGSTRVAKYGYDGTLPGDDWLYTPGLTLTGGTSYTVQYSLYDPSGSFPEAMDVYWGGSASAGSMTNLIADHTPVPTTVTTVSYAFTPGTSGTYYIGWHAKSTPDRFDFYLDDVSVVVTPSCPAPSALSATNLTTSGGDLGWTENGTATTWDLEIGTTGFTPAGTPTLDNVGANPYTWTGGSVSTAYDFYVRADCDMDNVGVSTWTGPYSFTTLATPPANDDCGNAVALTVNPDFGCGTVTSGTVVGATASSDANSCFGTDDDDVWYTFTATSTAHRVSLTNITGSTSDMYMSFSSGSCGSLTSVLCSDAETANLTGLSIGAVYTVRVYTYTSTPGQTSSFDVCVGTPPPPPPAPANDECSTAVALTVNADYDCGSVTAGTIAGATASADANTCGGTDDDDVWYSFTATSTAHRVSLINITGSTSDMYMAISSGSCGSLTSVLCSDPQTANLTGLSIGTTYTVRVYTYTSTPGQTSSFDVCVGTPPPPPANDLCANAIAVGANSVTPGTTVNATTSGNPGTCTTSLSTAPGVWYTVQGINGMMTASLCGSSFDTKMGIFTGTCGALNCVQGNDDDGGTNGAGVCGGGVQSSTSWLGLVGTTYYIYITGFSSNSGSFTLTLSSVPGTSVVVAINTDNNPEQITWEITDAGNTVVATGGPTVANGLDQQTVLLSATPTSACYGFQLMDSFGDGIIGGNWKLKSTSGQVLLGDDFADGFDSPSTSPQSASYTEHGFCLPAGPSNILSSECGIFTNNLQNKVYCSQVSGATSYQFEFSDPDAGFYRRIARNRNYVIFNEMVSYPLTPGVKYFARVRTNASGPIASAHFGSGCEMGLGVAQTIPCVGLIDAPAYGHSCNEERSFNYGNRWIYATPVTGATEYQFNISIPGEGYDVTMTRSTYILELKWNADVAPMMVNGSTYNVQVNVKVNGVYSGFCGEVCTITINTSGNRPEASMMQTNGTATMWPNPVREGQVNLSIDGIQDADQNITVDIQDIYGKQVFAKEFGNSGERFTTILDLPSDIASGVYMVNITVNGQTTVQRLSIIK